ncbi:MAG: hypothetical protein FWG87_04595 [Defluviitaleaceae bacterium]|nr:hypothetical protein [Defluviitaleaceae bacterium]
MVYVGDGFIRPEVTSLGVNGRYPSRIDERAYLGADKSAPYKNLQFPLTCGLINDLCNTDLTDLRGLCGFVRGKIRVSLILMNARKNPRNPCKSVKSVFNCL